MAQKKVVRKSSRKSAAARGSRKSPDAAVPRSVSPEADCADERVLDYDSLLLLSDLHLCKFDSFKDLADVPSRVSKRKLEEDDDDVTLLYPAEVSPKKTKRPMPGTPTFAALPPVSFGGTTPESSKKCRRLSFGSLDDASDSDSGDIVPLDAADVVAKETRRRKPSAKAEYMAADDTIGGYFPGSSTPRPVERENLPSPGSGTPKSSVLDVLDRDAAKRRAAQDKANNDGWAATPAKKSPGKPKTPGSHPKSSQQKGSATSVTVVSSDDERPLFSPSKIVVGLSGSPSLGRGSSARNRVVSLDSDTESVVVGKGKGKSPVKARVETKESDDELSVYEAAQHKGKSVKSSENPFVDDEAKGVDELEASEGESERPDNNDRDGDLVMRSELQDPLLVPYYRNLPALNYCEIVPFSAGVNAGDTTLLMYSPLLRKLAFKEEKIRLRRGINFVSHGCYVNPARIDPAMLSKVNGRIMMADSRQMAVFVTTGAIVNCNLVQPCSGGTSMSAYRIKNVSIYPLSQEHERTASCIGTVLGQTMLYGPMAAGALTYSTRKEGSTFGSVSSPSTPKAKGLFNKVKTPSRNSGAYPVCLGFEDTVPIYDGRRNLIDGPGFEFRDADFDNIKKLPLYQRGTLLLDVPPYTVVSVGYSLNAYGYSGSSAPAGSLAISQNVLFVIVLGKTDL